jgi:phosphoribosylformimino-5-aminoimidazole carboxamide ribotide isomerase
LLALAQFAAEGVSGAIVGKALYTGAVQLSAALRRMQEEV